MNGRYLALAGRIQQELRDLDMLVQRVSRMWAQALRSSDDAYVDATALNLHSYYAGIERIFEWIANEIDDSMPVGRHWHQDLLRQMAGEIPEVRPAVISPELRQRLDRYRGFRHVVRHVYTYNLDPEQVGGLADALPDLAAEVAKHLEQFLAFLEQSGIN